MCLFLLGYIYRFVQSIKDLIVLLFDMLDFGKGIVPLSKGIKSRYQVSKEDYLKVSEWLFGVTVCHALPTSSYFRALRIWYRGMNRVHSLTAKGYMQTLAAAALFVAVKYDTEYDQNSALRASEACALALDFQNNHEYLYSQEATLLTLCKYRIPMLNEIDSLKNMLPHEGARALNQVQYFMVLATFDPEWIYLDARVLMATALDAAQQGLGTKFLSKKKIGAFVKEYSCKGIRARLIHRQEQMSKGPETSYIGNHFASDCLR